MISSTVTQFSIFEFSYKNLLSNSFIVFSSPVIWRPRFWRVPRRFWFNKNIKDETMQEEIERNALNGQYETKEDKTPIVTIKSRRKSMFVGKYINNSRC